MMTLINLGRPIGPGHDGGDLVSGGLRHLPCTDAVGFPPKHLGDGTWVCRVVARRHPVRGGRFTREYVLVPGTELAAASRNVLVDPDGDPDTFAMVWVSLIWRRRLPAAFVVASTLADSLRWP